MQAYASAFGLSEAELSRFHEIARTQLLGMLAAEFRNPEAAQVANASLDTTAHDLNKTNR
jgi:hypothetical protein